MFEENGNEPIDDTAEDMGRPISITIVCLLGFLGAAAAVLLIASRYAKMVHPGYPYLLGLSTAAGLVCMIGLWNMKQWAAYLYTGLAIVAQMGLIGLGLWTPFSPVIPGIIVFIALKNINKMS